VADIVRVRECDIFRFDVNSFAKANVGGAGIEQVRNVFFAAPQIRLIDCSNIVELFTQIAIYVQRCGGDGGVFHVDANKVVFFMRPCKKSPHQAGAAIDIKTQSHFGQLDRGVAVQRLVMDSIECFKVQIASCLSL
jgi:hypothetical protein